MCSHQYANQQSAKRSYSVTNVSVIERIRAMFNVLSEAHNFWFTVFCQCAITVKPANQIKICRHHQLAEVGHSTWRHQTKLPYQHWLNCYPRRILQQKFCNENLSFYWTFRQNVGFRFKNVLNPTNEYTTGKPMTYILYSNLMYHYTSLVTVYLHGKA